MRAKHLEAGWERNLEVKRASAGVVGGWVTEREVGPRVSNLTRD
jgi:hypothetical protein